MALWESLQEWILGFSLNFWPWPMSYQDAWGVKIKALSKDLEHEPISANIAGIGDIPNEVL